MLESTRPRPAPRRAASGARWGRLLAVAALLPLQGCPNVPPYVERSYVRAGPVVMTERFVAEGDRADGPFYGLGATLGTLAYIERTWSVGWEAEFQVFNLDDDDLDGTGYRYFAGPRWTWNIDGRVRPTLGLGGNWTDFHLRDHSDDFDPSGPGAYVDLGVDWMVNPCFGLGVRARGMYRYEGADREHGMKPGADFTLQALYRF